MLDDLYDHTRQRVTALVTALPADRLDAPVPATPLWTVQQLVAHLAGAAADAVAGRVEGVGTAAWTAAQVAAREGHPIEAVLAEWADAAPGIVAGLAERRLPPLIVHDVLTHEADLREALDLGRPPPAAVAVALGLIARGVCKRFRGPGALVLRAGGREWTGGEGVPTTVEADPYELYRGLISRRSRAQMLAWTWTGAADEVVDGLPAWGPCQNPHP